MAAAMREQAGWCQRLGSPLYHGLLLRIGEDVDRGGVCWDVLKQHAGESRRSLLPLRLLAAVHRLVLEGGVPSLAQCYPSVGGKGIPESAWPAFRCALEANRDALHNGLPQTVQTNEVARCCALLPGFLQIALSTGLPMRLLEIGSSAGLNLRWDRYRYETPTGSWGPSVSPVVFPNEFSAGLPLPSATVSVVERRGCDTNPIDPTTNDGRLTLLSFVWPDQPQRFRQLLGAIEVARTVPASLVRADAAEWLETELADLRRDITTVVFHSVVLSYLSNVARRAVGRTLNCAGERATVDAPFAWLEMEHGEGHAEVYLTLWPGGRRQHVAAAGFHGQPVTVLLEKC